MHFTQIFNELSINVISIAHFVTGKLGMCFTEVHQRSERLKYKTNNNKTPI